MRPYLSVTVFAASVLTACETREPVAPSSTALEARGAPAGQELAAPSNVTATAVSTSQIDVTWHDNTTNEARFEVRRTIGGTSVIVTTTDANVVFFSDGGLASGVEHCYEVRAAKVLGANTLFSAFSNSTCAITLVPPPPPAPPPPPPPVAATNVRATPNSPVGVDVNWSADNTTATSFRIERSGDGGAPWVAVGTQTAYSEFAFFDYPVTTEQQVCYRVIAVNAGGDGPPSNTSCTTPPAGTILSGTLIDAQTLELRWNDNSAVEDGFAIFLHVYRGSMQCCPKSPDGSTLCDSGVYENYWDVAQVPPNVTTYRLPTIPADTVCGPPTMYSYYLLVMKDGGGAFSNEVSATTGESGGATAPLISAIDSRPPSDQFLLPSSSSTPRPRIRMDNYVAGFRSDLDTAEPRLRRIYDSRPTR